MKKKTSFRNLEEKLNNSVKNLMVGSSVVVVEEMLT